jgi:hypothetical protein
MRDFIAMIALQQGPGWNAQPISKRTALEVPPGRSLERDGAPPPFLNPQGSRFPLVCGTNRDRRLSLLIQRENSQEWRSGIGPRRYLPRHENHSVRCLPCHYGNFGSGVGFLIGEGAVVLKTGER